jgi:N-acetylglucosamine-6-sulfatase
MGRRGRFLTAIVAAVGIVAGLAVAGPGDSPPSAEQALAAGRPNVIVVESDDQTLESMKVMKNVNTLIGGQGVTFTNSVLNFSLCCPSRATFLTGQYAHNHGVWHNQAPKGGFSRFHALHKSNNLAVWLHRAGYFTAMIGKYMNEYRNQPPVPEGWSEWHAAAPYDQRVYNYSLNNNGALTAFGTDWDDFKGDVLTRKAVEFVNRRAPQAAPFFLWLNYTAPHVGGPPTRNPPDDCKDAAKPAPRDAHAFDNAKLPKPPNFNEADVSDKPQVIRKLPKLTQVQIGNLQRKYRCELESLLSIDVGVRKVVSALKARGALDNTLIIYTTDNGYFHGEHRVPGDKSRPYEESIKVPLQMRGPGIPKGVTLDPLVVNADLAPTILDAANARAGLTIDGRSLLPVVTRPGLVRNRQVLVEEPTYKAIRTERYMYVEYNNGDRELYDLQSDPYELQSLHNSPAYASVGTTLSNRLRKLKKCAGAGCRVFQPDPSP